MKRINDIFKDMNRANITCVMAPCNFGGSAAEDTAIDSKFRPTVMPANYKPRGFPSKGFPSKGLPIKPLPIIQRPVSTNPLTGSWQAQSFLSTYGIYILIFIIVLGIYYYRVYLPGKKNYYMPYDRNY